MSYFFRFIVFGVFFSTMCAAHPGGVVQLEAIDSIRINVSLEEKACFVSRFVEIPCDESDLLVVSVGTKKTAEAIIELKDGRTFLLGSSVVYRKGLEQVDYRNP